MPEDLFPLPDAPLPDAAQSGADPVSGRALSAAKRLPAAMGILIVTNYFAPEAGAAAVRLTRLAKRLRQRGHEITVLTSLPHYPQGRIQASHRGKAVVITEVDGIRVVQTWLLATASPRISRKLPSQLSFMASALLFGLRLPRPDVVLVEAQPVFTGIAGVLIALIKRRPYVLNVSDLWPDHLLSVGAITETHPVYRLARRMVDLTYRRAARIVAMSPRWADAIASYVRGHEDKISVVYNGVDLERFRPRLEVAAFRREHGLGDDRIISFIGTFSTQYDFDAILAVAEHFDRREGVRILFVGQGSQEAKLKERLQRFSRLTWIPWLAHEQMPQAWNVSWLTYWAIRDHPLYDGTIPAKAYEAMACGVPMVTAMTGVTADIIDTSGAGATVPRGDVAGLVREIAKVLGDDALRQRYSEAARRYAEVHYDAERAALAYERALAEALARPERVAAGASP
jgi:glycosyltransferase involved in cell wall biosynthesis